MNFSVFIALIAAVYGLSITTNTCITALCQTRLVEYFDRVNSVTTCDYSGDTFTIKVSHLMPYDDATGFNANAYTINQVNNGRYGIATFDRTDTAGKMFLNIRLSSDDIKTNRGCTYISDDAQYYSRECHMVIEYISLSIGRIVKEYYNKLTVRIPKTAEVDYVVDATHIKQYGCDCQIDATLTYDSKLFKADCTTVLENGSTLVYGDTICLFIRGTDSISRDYVFDLRNLTITYRDNMNEEVSADMLPVASVKCSIDNTCVKGQLYVTLRLIVTGSMRFNMIVALTGLRRLLAEELPTGMSARFTDSITVIDPENAGQGSEENTEESFSISTMVSALTFLAMLLVLI